MGDDINSSRKLTTHYSPLYGELLTRRIRLARDAEITTIYSNGCAADLLTHQAV